jgi:hypothetical protein
MIAHVNPALQQRNENIDNDSSCSSAIRNWRLRRLARQFLLPPATARMVAELVGIPVGEVD